MPFDWKIKESTSVEERAENVKLYLEYQRSHPKDPKDADWQANILPHLTLHSHAMTPFPTLTFRMVAQPVHANGLGNMHGGCTATIFDFCTSWPLHLIAGPGFWQYLGVSRTLNVTYLRPVPVGTTLDIQCEIVQAGQKLGATRGVMRKVEADGKLGPVMAICEHGKFNTDPPVPKL